MTVDAFNLHINSLLGWIGNELGRGRLTAVQADFLKAKVVALEETRKETAAE